MKTGKLSQMKNMGTVNKTRIKDNDSDDFVTQFDDGDSSEDEVKKAERKRRKEEARLKRRQKYKGKTVCKYCPRCVKCMQCILNNKFYVIFMVLITIYALFAGDIVQLTCPKSVDEIFWGITTGVFSMFLFELIISALSLDGYLFGFYFWLDLIATLSLVSDIGWIWNSIFTETTIE